MQNLCQERVELDAIHSPVRWQCAIWCWTVPEGQWPYREAKHVGKKNEHGNVPPHVRSNQNVLLTPM